MINETEIKNAIKLANDLQGKLDSLINATNKSLEALSPAEQRTLAFVSQDINAIMKAAKNGDLTQLQSYLNKYADSSNK
jgi:uncharacterized protein YdeI (YjbR/CyaY-like superfamily)